MSDTATDPRGVNYAEHECGIYALTDECPNGHEMAFSSWGSMQGAFYYCDECERHFTVIDWCECPDDDECAHDGKRRPVADGVEKCRECGVIVDAR